MSRKKKAPPAPSHRFCALCGNKGVVEADPIMVDMGRGKGPERYIQMKRCPGPRTQQELNAERALKSTFTTPGGPTPLSGQDRAAGEGS